MTEHISIFAYGSLINHASLRKTTPTFSHFFTATLPGYKRIFNLASPYRKDEQTGEFSSVLNLVKHENSIVNGMCFIADAKELNELFAREVGYTFELVTVYDEREAPHDVHTFIAHNKPSHAFLSGSVKQDEYVELCLQGAKSLGQTFYDTFLDTTYIEEMTLRTFLKHHASHVSLTV